MDTIKYPEIPEDILSNLSGKIPYRMTNDYMFHMVIQASELVQINLLSSLLHIPREEIKSVIIRNPIEYGKAIDKKTFILDIKILLNNDQLINIEMQAIGSVDWPDRSLSYLCREFDHLLKGQEYEEVMPVTHIGIIDFPLFPEDREFYASYMMSNIKSHRIYNDKFKLNVLSLHQIQNATEEDKKWNIDKWAALFQAKTWEDLKMISEKAPEFKEASSLIYHMNEDDIIRWQCEAREDFERHERFIQHKMKQAEDDLAKKDAELAVQKAELADKDAKLADKDAKLADKDAELADKDAKIAELEKQIAQLQSN